MSGRLFLGLVLLALACKEKSAPEDGTRGGGATSGAGGETTGGASGTVGGNPSCTTDLVPFSYGEVEVTGTPALRGTQRARVLERGVGLPPDLEDVGSEQGTDRGWLRVVELRSVTGASDARDAGAPDAGDAGDATDAASADVVVLGIERLILGPRELGELPVAIGDELEVSDESEPAGTFDHDQQIVLRQGGRTLLLRHSSTFRTRGLFAGVTLELGPVLCSSPIGAQSGSDARCADMNRHQLQVSVPIGPTTPGGAWDTLDPGEAKTVGDYRVLAGNTYTSESPTVYAYGRGCVPNDARLVQVTVVFAP